METKPRLQALHNIIFTMQDDKNQRDSLFNRKKSLTETGDHLLLKTASGFSLHNRSNNNMLF